MNTKPDKDILNRIYQLKKLIKKKKNDIQPKVRKKKYGAVKTQYRGGQFDSKKEGIDLSLLCCTI